MNKCFQHNKNAAGNCNWCGKAICENCVAKYDGKKIYCSKCAAELSPIITRRQSEKESMQRREDNAQEKKKFFDFDSIVQR